MNPLYCPHCRSVIPSCGCDQNPFAPHFRQCTHCGEDFILPGEENPAEILQAFNDRREVKDLVDELRHAESALNRIDDELTRLVKIEDPETLWRSI